MKRVCSLANPDRYRENLDQKFTPIAIWGFILSVELRGQNIISNSLFKFIVNYKTKKQHIAVLLLVASPRIELGSKV